MSLDVCEFALHGKRRGGRGRGLGNKCALGWRLNKAEIRGFCGSADDDGCTHRSASGDVHILQPKLCAWPKQKRPSFRDVHECVALSHRRRSTAVKLAPAPNASRRRRVEEEEEEEEEGGRGGRGGGGGGGGGGGRGGRGGGGGGRGGRGGEKGEEEEGGEEGEKGEEGEEGEGGVGRGGSGGGGGGRKRMDNSLRTLLSLRTSLQASQIFAKLDPSSSFGVGHCEHCSLTAFMAHLEAPTRQGESEEAERAPRCLCLLSFVGPKGITGRNRISSMKGKHMIYGVLCWDLCSKGQEEACNARFQLRRAASADDLEEARNERKSHPGQVHAPGELDEGPRCIVPGWTAFPGSVLASPRALGAANRLTELLGRLCCHLQRPRLRMRLPGLYEFCCTQRRIHLRNALSAAARR